MKHNTTRTLKWRRLKERLNLPEYVLKGILQALWDFTRENAPHGGIGRFTNQDIAFGIEYGDDADALVAALVETGWLDGHPLCRLYVHDWHDHCENSVHMRLARAGDLFADGSFPKLTGINKDKRPELLEHLKRKREKYEEKLTCAHMSAHEVTTRTRTETLTETQTIPIREIERAMGSVEGPMSLALILAGKNMEGSAGKGTLADRIAAVAQDNNDWEHWLRDAVSRIEAAGGHEDLGELVSLAEAARDPGAAAAKGIGIKHPGRWLASEMMKWARKHSVPLPVHPGRNGVARHGP